MLLEVLPPNTASPTKATDDCVCPRIVRGQVGSSQAASIFFAILFLCLIRRAVGAYYLAGTSSYRSRPMFGNTPKSSYSSLSSYSSKVEYETLYFDGLSSSFEWYTLSS